MAQMTHHELLVGQKAPYFERESTRGPVASWDLSGNQPRVLLFCPSPGEAECTTYLQRLAEQREELQRMEAVVAVIAGEGAAGAEVEFPVIANARDLFGTFGLLDEQGRPRAGVVILDRYGIVDSIFAEAKVSALPAPDMLVRRLIGAEASCPECGVPEPQWGSVTGFV